MNKARVLAVVMCVMAVANFASADTIRGINIDFVTIGNAGNAADTVVNYPDGTTGRYGAVGYEYHISKHETTNVQWNTFKGITGGDQLPINNISWYEATQFCNWLTSGNKYSGAYNFDQNGNLLGIDRASAVSSYGTAYVIPTEDEWYKAAYYKPNGSGYSVYANGSNNMPGHEDGWNYWNRDSGRWNVGTGTEEQNGTFDMMGNVWEWNETLIGSWRGARGGSYYDSGDNLASPYRYSGDDPDLGNIYIGFRVAEIPEPATILLLTLGGIVLRKQRRLVRRRFTEGG